MKSAAEIFGEIQMILARRLAGEIDDSRVVELISELMDRPDAMALSLDLVPDVELPRQDGGEQSA